MSLIDTLEQLAPTVASALGGPLAGQACSAIAAAFGMAGASQDDIQKAIANGQLTSEHIAELKKLEMQYQDNEKERGFKYAELEFKDRDSARGANVSGGIQKHLLWFAVLIVAVSFCAECGVLFFGYPGSVSDIVVGRVLGFLDSVAMLAISYFFGSSHGSMVKTEQAVK